ncbi:MAG: FAD-dependent oxidoreductase [Planctomycetes bacterium]|nr:FAD-dependent oxidoreductase [Planctomycetota bacterium]
MDGAFDTFDVVVVGGGGSGLACAVSAVENDAEVLVLEKQPRLGGATGIAVGSFTTSRSRLQEKAGIRDNPDDHEEDAAKFGPPAYQAKNNGALRRFFLGEATTTLERLMDMGLVFHGPSPEPPNRVPRMHNVVPNAKAYIAAFQMRLARRGGTVLCGAPVKELIREGGRVAGVVAEVDGARRSFRARHGVVLAAGDYANAPETIARFRGDRFAAIEGINPHAAGDGHRLAEEAGARMVNMEITYGPELRFIPRREGGFEQLLPSRGIGLKAMGMILPLVPRWVIHKMIKRLLVTWQHPDDAILADGAILINREGRRFCEETVSPDREIAVANQTAKIAYLLLDQRLCERYSAWPHFISTAPEIAYAYVADYLRLRPDVAVQGDSIERVAAARGLDEAAVRETVQAYNKSLSEGSAEGSAGGSAGESGRTPLSGSRWVLLGPVKAYFTTTEGGAAVDREMQVLDPDDRPIPGLFAVGQNGLGGMVLFGHGLHIAWALTSGRLAGEILAARARGGRDA